MRLFKRLLNCYSVTLSDAKHLKKTRYFLTLVQIAIKFDNKLLLLVKPKSS